MTEPQPLWRSDLPYNALPGLTPSAELESKPVLKACITARAALAELKQAAELIPNQTMLINTIPLLEAKDSSEIESIVTTTDQLFRHAQGDLFGSAQADPATKEALRDRSAPHSGYLSLQDRPLCIRAAVDTCRTIKGVDMDIRRTPGTQLINDRSGEIIYTPPEGEARLRELVDVIFEQPCCRIANLVDKGVAQRQAASRYLKDLVMLGVLQKMQLGKEKLFIQPQADATDQPRQQQLCPLRLGTPARSPARRSASHRPKSNPHSARCKPPGRRCWTTWPTMRRSTTTCTVSFRATATRATSCRSATLWPKTTGAHCPMPYPVTDARC